MQTFFSYARIDWNAPADRANIRSMMTGLAPQVHAAMGDERFELWRDGDPGGLRWGHNWRREVSDALGKSEFLIVLHSPAWLKSDACGWEFDTFNAHCAESGRTARILPILLREITQSDLQRMTDQQRSRHQDLRAAQRTDWRDLLRLDQRDLNVLLSDMACALKELTDRAADASASTSEVSQPSCPADQTPVDGHIIPPVSGDYYIPGQAPDTCQLKLAVAGMSSVELDGCTIVFAITGLTVQTTLQGGRIVNENPTFATPWEGPVAKVTRLQTGTTVTALQIEAKAEFMRGEPLVEIGASGHVHLFDIEAEDDARVEISGSVSIQRQAVNIIDEKCDLDAEGKERLNTMRRRLIDILISKHVEPHTQLEGARHDRTDRD